MEEVVMRKVRSYLVVFHLYLAFIELGVCIPECGTISNISS